MKIKKFRVAFNDVVWSWLGEDKHQHEMYLNIRTVRQDGCDGRININACGIIKLGKVYDLDATPDIGGLTDAQTWRIHAPFLKGVGLAHNYVDFHFEKGERKFIRRSIGIQEE